MPANVSVVVPSYNHAKFVERTLRSVLAQTLPPKKLIVIDDGSKDESPRVIERILAESTVAAELIVRPNRGLSATLNEGLAKADGEYFAYIGSDDIWLPEFLAEQTALLVARPSAILAFSHAYLIDEDDQIIDKTDNWGDFADGDLLPTLLAGQIFSSPGVLYRRTALETAPWNENAILEDYELYLRLAAKGEFARNEKLLCGWRQHAENVSRDFPLMLGEWLAAQNRVASELSIGQENLDRVQRRLRFDAAAAYVRAGRRREAFALFRQNFADARSARHIAETLLRIAVPAPFFDWNRRRKRRASIKKYGRLESAQNAERRSNKN